MSNIDLKRFVDINIQKQVEPVVVGTRDTTVLFVVSSIIAEHTISSYEEATQYYSGNTDLLSYCKMYFDNSGAKLLVKPIAAISSLQAEIGKLEDKYICVTCLDNATEMVKAATTRAANDTIYGINEKLLITRTTDKTFATAVKNLITKYSSVTGAEMTIAAYLSQIDVYGIDTIYDYAFTQEAIAAEDLTDAEYGTINSNNVNVDIVLANATRNCGGNCTDGADIVNNFVRIILHQTLTNRLLNLLTTKLKNSTGVSKIYTVMTDELEKYKTSGYLTIDKIWTKDTLKIDYNGTAYTVIEQGTPLTNGYFIKVLPLSSLTEDDKLAHKAPLIYVIIADQYGIRKITINGDVI